MTKTIRVFVFMILLSSSIAGFLVFSEQPQKNKKPHSKDVSKNKTTQNVKVKSDYLKTKHLKNAENQK